VEIALPLTIILVLLFLSAFFSGGELAMMALDNIYLETEARRGNRLAILQQRLRSRPQYFLSTILIGYNVANIGLATYGAYLAMRYLKPRLGEDTALAISTIVMTAVILIFAELMPKTLAAINTHKIANICTYPLYVVNILLTPLNWLLDKGVMPMIYAMSGGKRTMDSSIGREEIGTALALAYASGKLHSTDMAVARVALRLSTRDLADVMTPRVDVVAMPADCTIGETLIRMRDTGFSRLPVYEGDLDQVAGVLFVKDLVRFSVGGGEAEEQWRQRPARQHMRPATFFPATKSVVEALNEMRQLRLHLAVVVDEHGGTAGIVTLEDMLEELVGDIRDETDHPHSADIIQRRVGHLVVSGRARTDSIPELAGLAAACGDANTVGGLMMEQLGRPADAGDGVELAGYRLTALKVVKNRIKLMKIELPPDYNADAGDSQA
jgi:putative hemolysin